MNREKLHEMIDSCRPGSQDVHSSGMQPLAEAIARDEELGRAYQATQRADAAIGRAFRTVSPPEELMARLLESVAEVAGPEVTEKTQAVSAPRRSRRRFLVWGPALGLAIAASVAALVIYHPFAQQINFADDRARDAQVAQWISQAAAEEGWRDASTMPEGYPRPQHVSAKLARWKLLEDGRTVCYQFGVGEGRLAVLFVTRQATVGLPSGPKLSFTTAVSPRSIAWADPTHVYVLAVAVSDGSTHDLFRELVRLRAA